MGRWARKRAARGAALLDTQEPGWARRVNPDHLDIRHARWCVLGQLEGYRAMRMRLGLDSRTTVRNGFNSGVLSPAPALNQAWRREIAARREG